MPQFKENFTAATLRCLPLHDQYKGEQRKEKCFIRNEVLCHVIIAEINSNLYEKSMNGFSVMNDTLFSATNL